MKELFIDYNPYNVRVALLNDKQLVDFSVERAALRGLVGSIYKGKIENVLNGMKAAFVNIGLEKNGFLYVGESLVDQNTASKYIEKEKLNVSPGDTIMCQVTKDAYALKGPRLTTDITLPGLLLVFMPKTRFVGVSRKIEDEDRRNYLEAYAKSLLSDESQGFIVRSAAEHATDEDIRLDAERLLNMWSKIEKDFMVAPLKSEVFKDGVLLERAIRDNYKTDVDKIFVNNQKIANVLENYVAKEIINVYTGDVNIMKHYGVTPMIKKLTEKRVNLSNGAYIIIEKTEALTVIDVNTGKFVGKNNLEDTVFKTNMLASIAIATQLRVRNISGIIVVDFIDMADEEHRSAVLEQLKQELKKDRLKTYVASMTSLGLVEITRKRTRLPADSFLLQPCKSCIGGYVLSAEQLVVDLRDDLVDFTIKNNCDKVVARLNKEVLETIFSSNIMYKEIVGIFADKQIYLIEDKGLCRDEWKISVLDGELCENSVTLQEGYEGLAH